MKPLLLPVPYTPLLHYIIRRYEFKEETNYFMLRSKWQNYEPDPVKFKGTKSEQKYFYELAKLSQNRYFFMQLQGRELSNLRREDNFVEEQTQYLANILDSVTVI